MKLKCLALLAGVAGLLPACGRSSYVSADDAALGRVVVYRNGVAYYERRAHVEGDTLSLSVPADKIDDFLKSLTVADAKTGQPLPVSFPGNPGAAGTGNVDMTVTLPANASGGARDVVLTYVTEAPAWKPSYRVTVDAAEKVGLEGWAIVDNTSGEDWRSVKIGVGSSSALAFRYDLKSVRLVHRDILQSEERFAIAPPTGGSLFKNTEAEHVVDEMGDGDLQAAMVAQNMPAYDAAKDDNDGLAEEKEMAPDEAVAMSGGAYPQAMPASPARAAAKPKLAKAVREARTAAVAQAHAAADRLSTLAASLRQRGETVTIEGYANPGEADPQGKSLERANNLRNQLIAQGVPPAQLQAAGRGVIPGKSAGARLVTAANQTPPAASTNGAPVAPDAAPVGESHFESQTAMTVARGTSAMVSILKSNAEGEIVYLYDPEAERGDNRFAFRSVLFHNPTDSTLESGPVTVYGDARFIGEGLTEAIPPHATAVVPYALDRQVVIERQGDEGDRIAKLVTLSRGVLTCEVAHHRTTKLSVTNRQNTPAIVLVRHSTVRGWEVTRAPKDVEQYGQSRLYRVALSAGETKSIEIEESTPLQRTLDLHSPEGLTMVEAYLASPDRSPVFAEQMERLLKLNRDMHVAEETIASLRQRGDEYRARMDELHAQIVSLGLTRTGGTLTGHLQAKMREISDKVQQNTMAIVNQQEKQMLARVAFQDGVAELSLVPTPVATN